MSSLLSYLDTTIKLHNMTFFTDSELKSVALLKPYFAVSFTCCRSSSRSFFSCAVSFLLLSKPFAAASSSAPSFCVPHIC